MRAGPNRRAAFSLIELVIAAFLIGIIAFSAVPRFSRGAAGAADADLAGSLAVLRNALNLYAADHDGAYPALSTFERQMTQYTDVAGEPQATKDDAHRYGPYLRRIPVLPVGSAGYKNANSLVDGTLGGPGSVAGAWLYNPKTGDIKPNLADSEKDLAGKPYNAY